MLYSGKGSSIKLYIHNGGGDLPVTAAVGNGAATATASLDVFCFLFAPCTSTFASVPPLVPAPIPTPMLVSLRLTFFLISTVTAGVDALILLLLLPPVELLLFTIAC